MKNTLSFLVILAALLVSLRATPQTATEDVSYVGSYRIAADQTLRIEQTEQGLRGQLPNRPVFLLKESGPDRFRVEAVEVELVFLRNTAGEVYAVELRQPLTDLIASRISAAEAPPVIPTLSAEDQERYVGRYQIDGIFFIQIYRENNRLVYFPPGNKRYTLIPRGDNRFTLEGKQGQLEFTFNEEGKAQRFILQDGERQRIATRVEF